MGAVAIQAQIAVVRRPAVQRQRNAAQAKIAALIRWITAAREGQTAVARQTAASRKNVLGALVVARRRRAVKQSVDAASSPVTTFTWSAVYPNHQISLGT